MVNILFQTMSTVMLYYFQKKKTLFTRQNCSGAHSNRGHKTIFQISLPNVAKSKFHFYADTHTHNILMKVLIFIVESYLQLQV